MRIEMGIEMGIEWRIEGVRVGVGGEGAGREGGGSLSRLTTNIQRASWSTAIERVNLPVNSVL